MLSEDFSYLVEEFGKPKKATQLPAATIAALRGKLPDSLLDFWTECGVGVWLDGKFQFCNPEDYRSIVEMICGSDKDFDAPHCHAIGFSAFGELYIWHEKHRYLNADLPLLQATASMLRPQKLTDERAIATPLAFLDGKRSGEMYDDSADAKPLFARALKKLGELNPGEIYGFVPALGLGGPPRLENLQRVRALEHFAILAQIGRLRLMDYSSGAGVFVREIG